MALKDRFYDVPVVGTALRVQDRYKADAADQLAASIGFFAFLSLFPVMILAVAVTGFVLRGDVAAQELVVEAVTGAIPGFGALLSGGDDGTSIATVVDTVAENAGAIGVVGLVTLLLTGLRVINAAMVATTRVFRVPEPEGVKGKLGQLGALALLGLLALAGAVAGTSVGVSTGGLTDFAWSAAGTVGSLVFDLVLFLVAYRLLAARKGPGFRALLPGALLAAAGWTALKVFGATYVAGQAAQTNALYGALGSVIGLLLLLYLVGRLYLYGAELSALLAGIGTPPSSVAHVVPASADSRTPLRATASTPGDAGGEPTGADGTSRAATGRTAPTVRPSDPGPAVRSPAIAGATRQRVDAADQQRAASGGRADVRGALAFSIALAAVGLLLRAYRPWGADR